ncbi:MAG: hypothetical protein JRF15_02845 [Deltaproteobacteria bacterium]|nr:hypothetical protein [Deltaproteobacteria bacterium]
MPPTDEELEILSRKLMALKLAYDQYFLGSRPREPIMDAEEVRKLVVTYANQSIKNTAMRFKFNSIVSRYQAFKRQWTDTLRKIENGTYARHQFKSKLHERDAAAPPEPAAPPPQCRKEVFDALVEARQACGQGIAGLTPAKLNEILDQQERDLSKRYGDSQVRFKVVVENGRAKLTATRVG